MRQGGWGVAKAGRTGPPPTAATTSATFLVLLLLLLLNLFLILKVQCRSLHERPGEPGQR